jgi:serine/threonine protein kinase
LKGRHSLPHPESKRESALNKGKTLAGITAQEAGIMASLRHPHIVAFMGVCSAPPAIVTEYCERGSLTSLLAVAKALPDRAGELTWRFRIKMVCVGG